MIDLKQWKTMREALQARKERLRDQLADTLVALWDIEKEIAKAEAAENSPCAGLDKPKAEA